MSKKDKKVEIQIADAQVTLNNVKLDGYQLSIGKKVIGEVAEVDNQFAIIKDGSMGSLHQKLETAVAVIIEDYNLNR